MPDYSIYYIGNNNNIKSEKDSMIDYNFEYVKRLEMFEFLNKLLSNNLIENTQILIYLEDLSRYECEHISEILKKYSDEGKLYLNITIFNKTNNAFMSIQKVDGFKKIVNIFPFNIAIYVCDEGVYQSVKLINKTITVKYNSSRSEKKCFIIFYEKKDETQKGGHVKKDKIYNFRLMETNNSNILEETWWYKYYFSIPECAYGRLSQSSGTCWLNTILNNLFLSEPIAEILKKRYMNLSKNKRNEIEKIKSFNEFLVRNYSLEKMLWSLVNLILIQKKKATTLSGNFMAVLASKIKSLDLYNKEDYYLDNNLTTSFGDGHITAIGLNTVCNFYLKEDVDYYYLFNLYYLSYEMNMKMSDIYDKHKYLKNNLDDSNQQEYFELDEIVNKIINLHDKTNEIVKKMNETDDIITINWKDITFPNSKISENNPPKMIMIPTEYKDSTGFYLSKKIHQIIYIGDTEYKLITSGINFVAETSENTLSHIVAGLICKSRYYIYDSNNLISYSDWNQSVYNDYIEKLGELYKVNSYRIEYKFCYAIYICD